MQFLQEKLKFEENQIKTESKPHFCTNFVSFYYI